VFDDDNEEKIERHGLSARRVLQILDGEHVIVRNRGLRRGALLIIGRDHGGSCIAVPVEPTHDPTGWRPITAWPCKARERSLLG
jgi:hypothetical protein